MAAGLRPIRFACLGAVLLPSLGVPPAVATDDAPLHGLPPAAGLVLRDLVSPGTAHVVGRARPIGIRVSGPSQLRMVRREFVLAPGLRRPRPGWWLTAADVRVELASDSGLGEAVIGLGSNGRTWAQIEIFKKPGNGRPIIEWNTLDIVRGYPCAAWTGRVLWWFPS